MKTLLLQAMLILVSFAWAYPADAKPIFLEVPFTWQLTTNGDNFASAFVSNAGPVGTAQSDSDSLAGNFVVSALHAPPDGFTRVDPLPTEITLNVIADWQGLLMNSSLALDLSGQRVDTYVKSTAVVSAPAGMPAFVPSTREIGGWVPSRSVNTEGIYSQENLSLLVGAGIVPFSGSVDIQTLFGFVGGVYSRGTALGTASLEITGSLFGATNTNITYQKVPEPSTLFLTVIGLMVVSSKRLRRSR